MFNFAKCFAVLCFCQVMQFQHVALPVYRSCHQAIPKNLVPLIIRDKEACGTVIYL